MRIIPLFTLFFIIFSVGACQFQTENSVSNDKSLFETSQGQAPTAAPSKEFEEVRVIVNERCVKCHKVFAHYAETHWVENGYIVAGSARSSLLYNRLRGSGSGEKEDMPQDGALSASEVTAFYNWIQRMHL